MGSLPGLVGQMDYFRVFNLNKEPFSNSPDPDFFFQTKEHLGCLQKLELSIRLHRGLSVVLGEVGTGKTTLCRQLIRYACPWGSSSRARYRQNSAWHKADNSLPARKARGWR